MELILVDGEYKNLKIKKDNKIITIHSSNPIKEAERIVSHFNNNMEHVILAGIGLGYIVEYIINNTNYKVLIFENSNEILNIIKSEKKELLTSKRIEIFSNLEDLFDYLDRNYIKEFNFYIHRPYLTLFPEIYTQLENELITYLSKKKINQNTLKRFQKTWLKNIIKNSIYYFKLPGIMNIKHNFKDKPAIIVGAGPSLSRNIEMLKKQENKAVIISTDTALARLIKNDIIPDFVISVDPQDRNSLYLLGIKEKDKLPLLVVDSAIAFLTISHYPIDNIILYDTIFPLYEEIKKFSGEKGTLKSGGSVSTTAFDFARFLGCSPIIFIGQDLSYTGFKTHSENNILEEMFFYSTNRLNNYETYNAKSQIIANKIKVKGNIEQYVTTDRKFMTFIEWFKREIKNSTQKVINSTEGGALIEGAIHLPLLEALKEYKDFNKIIEINKKAQSEENYIKYLKDIVTLIDEMLPNSYKAIKACEQLLNNFKITKNPEKYFNDMNDFDIKFLKATKKEKLGKFVELTMQETILKLLERKEESLSEKLISDWLEFYKEAKNGLIYVKYIIIKTLKFYENINNK